MKRRKFIKDGFGTLAVSATNPINLSKIIAPNWANISPEEMDNFLIAQDGALDLIANDPGGGRFLDKVIQRPLEDNEAKLFRGGMRSLLFSGNLTNLSIEGQVHPGVQERLLYSAPEFDSTVQGITDNLRSLSPSDRTRIKSALSQDPDLADRVLEAIDFEARSVGAPSKRLRQLRRMGKDLIKRLKQSPDLVIDEYLTKYDKFVSRIDSDEKMKRFMIAHMGQKKYETFVQKAESGTRRWQMIEVQNVPIKYQPNVSGEESVKGLNGKEKADRYRKGLSALGIGLIITGAGWVLIGIGVAIGGGVGSVLVVPGVVAGVTVGPIIILIALIILLVKAIIGPSK